MGTRVSIGLHWRRNLNLMISTCQKLDAICDFRLGLLVDKEVVAFEILIAICEDGCIFEVDGGGGCRVVVDDFVGGLGEKEVEMNVVFAGQTFQH